MLNIFDLYDLHAIFVNIRNNPANPLNEVIVSKLLQILTLDNKNSDTNQIRVALRELNISDQQEYSFALCENVYTYIPCLIKDENIYKLLRLTCDELLKVTRNGNLEQIEDLADALHNLPLLLAENNLSLPKRFLDYEVKYYQKKWNKLFLAEYKKQALFSQTASAVWFFTSNGNLIKQSNELEFLYDHTGVFTVKYGGSTYFYRKDAQANIVALLDNTGAVVVKYKYDAWGNCKVLNANGTEITDDTHIGILNPFRYRSYYYDTGIGLYFLKTRYYDPEIGRFMTIDDLSYLDPESINGLNLYAYCLNNPINCIDPTGNAPWWSWLLSGLQLVGGIALCFVPGAQAIGVNMIAGGFLGLIANAVAPAIAQVFGGASSMANGWGAISTGISLLSFGTPGIIAGIGLMLVGGATMAFGANEIVSAFSGTNYIQEWTGMSDSAYGWTYFGLNVASSVGTSAGRWGMRVTATNIYNNTGEIKPYAVVSSDTKIVYYDGRGKMSWSTHLTNHGHPKQHPYVPHWHVELPHYPSGGFKNRYQLFWELILRSFGGGHR